MKKAIIVCAMLLLSMTAGASEGRQHPHLLTDDSQRAAVLQRIEREPWARSVYQRLCQRIDPIVEHTEKEPDWLLSRLAMYWRRGEHYTQCYLHDERWERGEGCAPVPTVRMPGERTWNAYRNVPLAERQPYNETGDMMGEDTHHPGQRTLVDYRHSGHLIRGNNVEILSLAEQAAFLYWLTREERYARMANGVLQAWLIGTYYMQPIIDLNRSTGSGGGYEPGGICGYYDYEQIHDDLALHAAVALDFIHDYAQRHPHRQIKKLRLTPDAVADTVMSRFVRIGSVRGGKSGNWNVNGWNMMMLPMLSLGPDSQYADGHGRDYYIRHFLHESTPWHDALPDILCTYDAVTGLWPESPGYGFGTIGMLSDFALMLRREGIDMMSQNPVFQKAALAMIPWTDSRANLIVFGDSRGGTAPFGTVENLYAYYCQQNDTASARRMASLLQAGMATGTYSRHDAPWQSLLRYAPLPETAADAQGPVGRSTERSSYSPFHRLATMKSSDNALMAVLYGGRAGSHLSPNGLALQLYGFGYALAPDASAYVSYWSDDHRYHQQATGSNTVIPGYTEGDITLDFINPAIPDGCFTDVGNQAADPLVNMVQMTTENVRRSVAVVSCGDGRGYYVDVLRSPLGPQGRLPEQEGQDADYLMHVVGRSLTVTTADGRPLAFTPADSLWRQHRPDGYRFFTDTRQATIPVASPAGIKAEWTIDNHRRMTLWMLGSDSQRTVFTTSAPSTTLNPALTPGGVSATPQPTPTLIVRQQQADAWRQPFVCIMEPHDGPSVVERVECLKQTDDGLLRFAVWRRDGQCDVFCATADGQFTKEADCNMPVIHGRADASLNGQTATLYRHGNYLEGEKNQKLPRQPSATGSSGSK